MSEFNIEVQGGSSVRLPTAGKYCEKDIIVTASGGGGTEEIEQIIDQSGVLETTDGTATEKVEQLIDKAEDENLWYMRSTETSDRFGTGLFHQSRLTKLPRLDLSKNTNLSNFCTSASIERIDQYLNTESCSLFTSAFGGTLNLVYLKGICTKNATRVNSMFYDSAIKEIEVPFDFSNVQSGYSSAFQKASALVEVRFVTETIKVSILFTSALLSADSIQSIIDGLAYVTTSQNLTLYKDVVVTDNQKQVIRNKGWTLIQ